MGVPACVRYTDTRIGDKYLAEFTQTDAGLVESSVWKTTLLTPFSRVAPSLCEPSVPSQNSLMLCLES